MPGNTCCSERDDASRTESPTAVMSRPETSAVALAWVVVLALTPATALTGAASAGTAVGERPSASALAPCEICCCRPVGAPRPPAEHAVAQTTIATRIATMGSFLCMSPLAIPQSQSVRAVAYPRLQIGKPDN